MNRILAALLAHAALSTVGRQAGHPAQLDEVSPRTGGHSATCAPSFRPALFAWRGRCRWRTARRGSISGWTTSRSRSSSAAVQHAVSDQALKMPTVGH